MSHLTSKEASNSDYTVEKLRDDIDTLEKQVKEVIDLQKSLLEGRSNLELQAKQISHLAHCLAREISSFCELAVRLNSTYQILLQQIPEIKIPLTTKNYALKQLIWEDIVIVIPTSVQQDFSFILNLIEVFQQAEKNEFTYFNQLQNKLKNEIKVPLSTLQLLSKLSFKVKEFNERDLILQPVIFE